MRSLHPAPQIRCGARPHGFQPLSHVMCLRALRRRPNLVPTWPASDRTPIVRSVSAHAAAARIFSPLKPNAKKSADDKKTTASSDAPTPGASASTRKFRYPERLLVYHAGTGKVVFVGTLKVVTLIILGFFAFVQAPVFVYRGEEPWWVPIAVISCGAIPFIFVAYITSPFAAFIHLRLPPYARSSPELLRRYVKTLPHNSTAELDITTIGPLGRQRVLRVRMSRLYAQDSRFGLANFSRRREQRVESRVSWWFPRLPRDFWAAPRDGVMKEKWVWEEVRRAIWMQTSSSDSSSSLFRPGEAGLPIASFPRGLRSHEARG